MFDELQKKYLKRMKKVSKLDTEIQHGEYDRILLDLLNKLGFVKIVKEFNKYDFGMVNKGDINMKNEQIIKDLMNALEETWKCIWNDKNIIFTLELKKALNITNKAIMNVKLKGD